VACALADRRRAGGLRRSKDVLRAWVGLGYNRRAVRLWEAARSVARDGWPERLQDLPGVGPYTAAAVGSFAFGRQEVALDTNARRLFARLGAAPRPAAGTRRRLQPGDDGAGRDGVHGAGAAVRRVPAARGLRRPRAAGAAGAARGALRGLQPLGPRPRGGRAGGRGRAVPRDLAPDRLQPALQGLLRDGLIRRVAGGYALG
jgi:A/G-specific adenine glycosylase